jgi:hypothetical protein
MYREPGEGTVQEGGVMSGRPLTDCDVHSVAACKLTASSRQICSCNKLEYLDASPSRYLTV